MSSGKGSPPTYSEKVSDMATDHQQDTHTNLGIARVCVEDVGEELGSACHACNDQSVDVEAIDNKEMREVQGISFEQRGYGRV